MWGRRLVREIIPRDKKLWILVTVWLTWVGECFRRNLTLALGFDKWSKGGRLGAILKWVVWWMSERVKNDSDAMRGLTFWKNAIYFVYTDGRRPARRRYQISQAGLSWTGLEKSPLPFQVRLAIPSDLQSNIISYTIDFRILSPDPHYSSSIVKAIRTIRPFWGNMSLTARLPSSQVRQNSRNREKEFRITFRRWALGSEYKKAALLMLIIPVSYHLHLQSPQVSPKSQINNFKTHQSNQLPIYPLLTHHENLNPISHPRPSRPPIPRLAISTLAAPPPSNHLSLPLLHRCNRLLPIRFRPAIAGEFLQWVSLPQTLLYHHGS